ncbi:SDR family NAD(P)-dependent oxidoreductase [Limosilactobacillus reuteri]|uniref:SDR family NAD(P)-dependent oxidoreductase n=1 Tax=Limosilactobacillus reuteri TaxID=1598 RepID=UPI001E4E57C2|nr:SDR family NAD(P)-dependent oxidoreductase [Limosilactobacillus reuteri]UFK69236.1 3-oxoacyl-[acyl-carrier-protein] reductase FabG [Limosilactobacillus reuteri]
MKSVLITGITGGIGRKLTEAYSSKGYHIYGTCSRNSDSLQQFKEKWPSVEIIQINHDDLIDVSTEYSFFFRKVQPDIVINNAGIVKDNFLVQMSVNDFQEVLTTNLISAWVIVKEMLLHLNDNKIHKIINVASISGIIGREGQCNYAATKGGLVGLCQLIEHLAPKGSNVISFSVAPGLIDTDIKGKMPKKKIDNLKKATLANRLGTPEEVSKFIFKLSEEDISYSDGTLYRIDGGVLK